MRQSLAERLKSETRALHVGVERSAFMGRLLRGSLARPAYCALLRNLHSIYAALEPAMERHLANPVIAPLVLPGLWRALPLEHDLAALHGPDWRAAFPVAAATRAYVERLHELERTRPALLAAHAYVRYLGDLSGGQVLRGIVSRSIAGADAGAVAFYDFGDDERTLGLKRSFRSGIESIAVDEGGVSALVDEAAAAFVRHGQLFEELETAHPGVRGPGATDAARH